MGILVIRVGNYRWRYLRIIVSGNKFIKYLFYIKFFFKVLYFYVYVFKFYEKGSRRVFVLWEEKWRFSFCFRLVVGLGFEFSWVSCFRCFDFSVFLFVVFMVLWGLRMWVLYLFFRIESFGRNRIKVLMVLEVGGCNFCV